MKARPILFSAPMIRALLEGRKTQTRRVIKPQPIDADALRDVPGENRFWAAYAEHDSTGVTYRPLGSDQQHDWKCPYGVVGDLLWCRETWARIWERKDGQRFTECDPNKTYVGSWYEYAATSEEPPPTWRPSIHMPREASRLTLEITDVRVQRLQEISEVDAIDEGVMTFGNEWLRETFPHYWHSLDATPQGEKPPLGPSPRERFRALWGSINGAGSWAADPFVWALTFKVRHENVDAVLKAAA